MRNRFVQTSISAYVLWLDGGDALQTPRAIVRSLLVIGIRRFIQLRFLRRGSIGAICSRYLVLLFGDRRSRWLFCFRRLRLSVGRVHFRGDRLSRKGKRHSRRESVAMHAGEKVNQCLVTVVLVHLQRSTAAKNFETSGEAAVCILCTAGGGESVWRTKAVSEKWPCTGNDDVASQIGKAVCGPALPDLTPYNRDTLRDVTIYHTTFTYEWIRAHRE